MSKIAIIQFPGTNCEAESFRAIKDVGMEPELFRWNRDKEDLRKFDGYFIPGGFSYEDRVRSGAIAGRDPLMKVIKQESAKGKPVIGICNGAQILVESGMIPGLEASHLGASLSWNEKGCLNIWVRIKNDSDKVTAFNNFDKDFNFSLPIAHGEGRWVIADDLLKKLTDNGQTVFKYCDTSGDLKDEYPVNPNGSVNNLAGVSNKEGNVLALMPHPERTKEGLKIFESMKKYIEENKEYEVSEIKGFEHKNGELNKYSKEENSLEFLVDLIITDNEAETLQIALSQLDFNTDSLKRYTHWEVSTSDTSQELKDKLIKSGELLNTNKEIPYINDKSKLKNKTHKVLIRYKDDFTGHDILGTLNNRLGITQVSKVLKGVLWEIECTDQEFKKIINSHILFNPLAQIALIYE